MQLKACQVIEKRRLIARQFLAVKKKLKRAAKGGNAGQIKEQH